MEGTTLVYSFLSLIFFLFCFKQILFQSKKQYENLPPSPPSLPILGHLHIIKPPFHRFCQSLSHKYGPIFSLQLGSRLMVIVSSPTAVEECFTKNDVVLANRPASTAGKYLFYDNTAMILAPYGDHWRNLRRIGAIEIFSSSRLNAFVSVRRDEIRRLLMKLSRDSRRDFAKVELRSLLSDLTFNNMMRMIAGKRYYGDEVTNEAEAREFKQLIAGVFECGEVTNPADFLPMWKWFFRGYENKVKKLGKNLDKFLQNLVDEHRSQRQEKNDTMIYHLLSLQESEPDYYTDETIKGLILVMLVAGTDTSVVTLEWAMSNLLNHPEALKKAREEIDTQIGQENLIDEPDVSKLHYLQSIIFETLRLYPTVPLLVPHVPSSACTIGGYNVPRGAIVMVNAWSIHRDPELWDDATSFKPERFEKEKGESYKLMPFGVGRRACPGSNLAHRLMGLTLGSLIQCFEWERVDEKEIDMTEKEGRNTMPKLQPLEAMCKARHIVNKVF